MAKTTKAKTSTGLDENIAGLLCYVAWWVTGIIFFIIEKDNKFIRFHAMQSIVVFGIITLAYIVLGPAIGWIPILGQIIMGLLGVFAFVLWIILILKAYQGEKFKLPWAGNIAEKAAR